MRRLGILVGIASLVVLVAALFMQPSIRCRIIGCAPVTWQEQVRSAE